MDHRCHYHGSEPCGLIPSPGLVRVNRELYREATPILYSRNQFTFSRNSTLYFFLLRIGQSRTRLERIEIHQQYDRILTNPPLPSSFNAHDSAAWISKYLGWVSDLGTSDAQNTLRKRSIGSLPVACSLRLCKRIETCCFQDPFLYPRTHDDSYIAKGSPSNRLG